MPNFFIIGAPKCGTTSLASWLGAHPKIFMSTPKEPDYYNVDFVHPDIGGTSWKQYERIFYGAGDEHKAVGEASTKYLYSEVAVPTILRRNPAAKFIVCLRPPSEMAVSMFGHQRRDHLEPENDFKSAWNSMDSRDPTRLRGGDPRFVHYGRRCQIGHQVQRLMKIVPADQVHFILLEDMKDDPMSTYAGVLQFLNLESDDRTQFPIENEARTYTRTTFGMINLIRKVQKWAGIYPRRGMAAWLQRKAARPFQRPHLDAPTLRTLNDYFEADIRILESVLGRDLSHWRKSIHPVAP